jgi:hypothetical protein
LGKIIIIIRYQPNQEGSHSELQQRNQERELQAALQEMQDLEGKLAQLTQMAKGQGLDVSELEESKGEIVVYIMIFRTFEGHVNLIDAYQIQNELKPFAINPSTPPTPYPINLSMPHATCFPLKFFPKVTSTKPTSVT